MAHQGGHRWSKTARLTAYADQDGLRIWPGRTSRSKQHLKQHTRHSMSMGFSPLRAPIGFSGPNWPQRAPKRPHRP
eukprot:6193477-Pyramimonas_sp.AAC.1